jgi:membrane-associated protein
LTELALEWFALYGLPVYFVMLASSALGIPMPVKLLMLVVGAFVQQGEIAFGIALAVGSLGAITGDQAGYFIGRKGGRPAINRITRRFGGAEMVKRAEAYADKWGLAAIFFSRWLVTPVGPWLNLLSGSTNFSWIKFTAVGAVGETIWVLLYLLLGLFFSDRVEATADLLVNLSWVIVGLTAVIFLGWKVRQFLRNNSADPAAEPSILVHYKICGIRHSRNSDMIRVNRFFLGFVGHERLGVLMIFRDRAFLFVTVLILIAGLPVYSQTVPDVIERVREIEFFESDREAVKQVLYEMVFDGTYGMRDGFTFGDLDISIHYSTGECDEEDDVFESEAGKVVRIVISSSKPLLVQDIGFDLSTMKREQVYRDLESRFVYHDKRLGKAVTVYDDEVEEVLLFPSVASKVQPCDFKRAREFIEMESWFGSENLEKRSLNINVNQWANVIDLVLSAHELAASTNRQIEVLTTALDPENDPLTYVYTVTAGRIIGRGHKVVWDLSGVAPGTYEITVGADDGCGICRQPAKGNRQDRFNPCPSCSRFRLRHLRGTVARYRIHPR